MIIAVCGNGYCGSSAVTDYLRETSTLAVAPYDIEFMFLYDVDGLDDLRHHLVERPVRYYSSDAAIKRFQKYIKRVNSPNSSLYKLGGEQITKLTDEYIASITQIRWHGWWHFDVYNSSGLVRNWNFRLLPRINSIYKKITGKSFDIYPKAAMQMSIKPESFDEATKRYINALISLFNPHHLEKVVLDQPFPVGTADYYSKYFSDSIKTINVVRDPRDVFIAAKHINKTYSSWIPTESVEDFIEYFRLIEESKGTEANDQLTIHFEDMIYNYQSTADIIDGFLRIESSRSKQFFCPEKSINNTQLFRKFTQYKREIEIIERELPNHIYDYKEGACVPNWENMF